MPISTRLLKFHLSCPLADPRQESDERTDGDLLNRFANNREQDAFATLVRRHAGMVWCVCRRFLLNPHDAEDAFQATFLVLVSKASQVPKAAVGNWLHGVARQTAVRLRSTVIKRGRREMQVLTMPESAVVEVGDADMKLVIEQELSHLPKRYEVVITLCNLEGLTRKVAARKLGIPEGSVASRLARAKALLARRLAQRGILFSGTLAVSMSLPLALVESTIKAASPGSAGQAVHGVSLKVAALTKGVLKSMLVNHLKAVFSLLMPLCLLLGGATFPTYFKEFDQNSQEQTTENPANPAKKEQNTVDKFPEDKELLQGTWQVVEAFGKSEPEKITDEEGRLHHRAVFKGDQVDFHGEKAKFVLDPSKKPKQMDWTQTFGEGKGNRVLGIYDLNGDTLRYCLAIPGELRPTEFKAIDGPRPEGKTILYVFKRIKPEDEKKTTVAEGAKPEKEPFTTWGKEVGGLQAGLGFAKGEKRVYHQGETAKLVLRVRNVGKEAVEFKYIRAFFIENPPKITDADGKIVQLPNYRTRDQESHMARSQNVLPGKEVDLFEWTFDLQPKIDPSSRSFIPEMGQFRLQCDRIVGSTWLNPDHPNPTLDKLATGSLKLEVREAMRLSENKPLGKEVDFLQGEWAIKAWQEESVNASADELIGKKLLINGNAMGGVGSGVGGSMSFKLNSEKTPNEIDLTILDGKRKGITEQGIYKIEGDQLRICYGGKVRPKDFTTKPGSGHTLLTLQKEPLTAWGKEVGGLQAGLGFRPGEQRAYHHGEAVSLVIRVRNVGKETTNVPYFQRGIECNLKVTGRDGQTIPQPVAIPSDPTDKRKVLELPPGKETDIYELKRTLRPAPEGAGKILEKKPYYALYGTGKVLIQCDKILPEPMDKILGSIATGKLEMEVKDAEKKNDKEPFIAWGKEVGGLQAGLSISNASDVQLGGKATVVVRLRNVSNDPISVSAWPLWLIKPTIVHRAGEQVRTTSPSSPGFDLSATEITLKPGQTVMVATNNIFVVDANAKDGVRHEGVADQFTIHVRPGKHSMVLKGFLEGRPNVATGTVDFEVKTNKKEKPDAPTSKPNTGPTNGEKPLEPA